MGFIQDLIRKNQKRGDTPLPQGKALGTPRADNLLYAHNPIYIEVSQGGISYARGMGGLAWGGGGLLFAYMTASSLPDVYEHYSSGVISTLGFVVDVFFASLICVIGSGMFLFFLWSLFGPADAVVRFDRKRRKAYRWTADGTVVESDWDALTPCTSSAVGSAYGSITIHSGVYVEYDSNGNMLFTGNLPHRLQIGTPSPGKEEVLSALEYVRRFMELGHEAVPVPKRLLRYRPHILTMWLPHFVVEQWQDWKANKDAGGHPSVAKPPIAFTVTGIIAFPFFFMLQCTHWLSRWTARIPKWPKEIRDMHEQDLREWEAQQKAQQAKANKPKRKPVIRLNGKIISGGDD